VAEEIGGIQAVLLEKSSIPAATVHDVRRQLPAEFGLRFLDDPRQPGDPFELRVLGRQIVGRNSPLRGRAVLNGREIIAAPR
jgi:hypothetical protein